MSKGLHYTKRRGQGRIKTMDVLFFGIGVGSPYWRSVEARVTETVSSNPNALQTGEVGEL